MKVILAGLLGRVVNKWEGIGGWQEILEHNKERRDRMVAGDTLAPG
jgi:hypothetical protein